MTTLAKLEILGLLFASVAGCSHAGSKESHAAVLHWDAELSSRLGKSTRADILSLMGEPTARDLIGDSEVWVYRYGKDDRDIQPELRAVAPEHDELMLTFDHDGALQRYSVILEGRSTQRQRGR